MGTAAARRRRGARLYEQARTGTTQRPARPSHRLAYALGGAILLAAALAAWHHSAAEGALRGDGVVCEDDTHNFEQLAASLAQHRALVDNVGLYHTDGLRGLKATKAIRRGSTVLAIPYTTTLSVATSSVREAILHAATTWHQSSIHAWDTQLETLALLYEAYVRGGRAAGWLRAYMCTLPRGPAVQAGLPTHWRLETAAVIEALEALPDLAVSMARNKEQAKLWEGLAREAVLTMPGGKERLAADTSAWEDNSFSRAYQWALTMARTRSISLDLTRPLGTGVHIPSALVHSSVQELGLLVPLLDLVNHAPQHSANTHMAVDMTSKSITGGRSPVFTLVATRDIQPGEQITMPYIQTEDPMSECDIHWLTQYGFIIDDGRPERDCTTFNITISTLASVLAFHPNLLPTHTRRHLSDTKPHKALSEALLEHLHAIGAPEHIQLSLTRAQTAGEVQSQLARLAAWAAAAAGARAELEDAASQGIVCALLSDRVRLVEGQVVRTGKVVASANSEDARALGLLLHLMQGSVRALRHAANVMQCG